MKIEVQTFCVCKNINGCMQSCYWMKSFKTGSKSLCSGITRVAFLTTVTFENVKSKVLTYGACAIPIRACQTGKQ